MVRLQLVYDKKFTICWYSKLLIFVDVGRLSITVCVVVGVM